MKNKVIIIAEIGVNHNGNLKLAKKLIKKAKEAGADFVKFQSFKVDELLIKNTKMASYQISNLKKKKLTQYDMLSKYEINDNFHRSVINYSKFINIKFLTSPFDIKSIHYLKKFKLNFFKIPSGEITNYPYLKEIGSMNKYTFLSTGMSTFIEVKNAVNILVKNGLNRKKLYVMHCHTDYPSEFLDLNLNSIPYLRKKLKLKVGYSDHSLGLEAGVAAVALGSTVIEKHITLNKNLPGPDHKASMEIKDFNIFVKSIRNTELALGDHRKFPSKKELKILKVVRKSIYAKVDIKIGEKFSENNLITKRPLLGISADKWRQLIGKKALKNYKKNQPIKNY